MRAISEFWNCAVTVSGCFLVFTEVWLLMRFWPAVSVFTDWRFFKPFFGLSRGRNDLFFLNMNITKVRHRKRKDFLRAPSCYCHNT